MSANVNFDLLACENGTVWYTCESAPEPTNIAKEFQARNIPINFAAKAWAWNETIFFLGGPTGLFSNFNSKLTAEKSDVPDYFCWEGAKDFRDCDLRWFNPEVNGFEPPRCFYFNAKGNVYRTTEQKPFYQLVWKNCSILQLNAGPQKNGYLGCYLSNGEVWVKENPDNCRLRILPTNIDGWIHLSFFDDKNVKIVLAMHYVVYILCEYPEEQRLFCLSAGGYNIYFGYRKKNVLSNFKKKMVKEEGLENIPLEEDKTMSSRTILKLVGLSEIVLCWCKEGVYFWRVDNGSSPLEETECHPVCRNSHYFYPFKFFDDKNIIDVAAEKHFYVLCDDGVYTIPSETEEGYYSRNFTLTPLKLPIFDENLPVLFSSYFSAVSKLGKSARSRIEPEEPEFKKQKVIDEENENKDDKC